jgi:hypothetical protein
LAETIRKIAASHDESLRLSYPAVDYLNLRPKENARFSPFGGQNIFYITLSLNTKYYFCWSFNLILASFHQPHRFVASQVTNFPLASISTFIPVRKLVMAQSCHATPPPLP